jgi:hypothetical protein
VQHLAVRSRLVREDSANRVGGVGFATSGSRRDRRDDAWALVAAHELAGRRWDAGLTLRADRLRRERAVPGATALTGSLGASRTLVACDERRLAVRAAVGSGVTRCCDALPLLIAARSTTTNYVHRRRD